MMTGVARELNLSDNQVDDIRRIIDSTNQAIARNEGGWLLLEDSRRKAIGLLNHQQRRRWESLSGNNGSPRGPDGVAKVNSALAVLNCSPWPLAEGLLAEELTSSGRPWSASTPYVATARLPLNAGNVA